MMKAQVQMWRTSLAAAGTGMMLAATANAQSSVVLYGMTLASVFPHAPLAFTSINMGLVALFANAVVFVAISGAQRMLRPRIDTAVESA
ncbi:Na+/solute symporter [Caballeronia temeraria]|uniref:Na+/solute symporter n=1 Tax=Caballeronia temeraria TaxID=1777137 RepID=A0A158CEJ7_9BURK|nr:hypothetical protein [Caballeronia temeraria]SAK80803.1 Na+/solute symporter [Caballeronia temeraria]